MGVITTEPNQSHQNYLITFETVVQRLVMNMPNIHRSARMDVVRYITEWLLRRPQYFTSHTPQHLARAVTRSRAIDFIRQQARQSAACTWDDIEKRFVGNIPLDEMIASDRGGGSGSSDSERSDNPETLLLDSISRDSIDQALIRHLTKKQYDVFTLRAFDDFSVNEIAAITGSKHYNVSKLYSAAQERLRDIVLERPEEFGF